MTRHKPLSQRGFQGRRGKQGLYRVLELFILFSLNFVVLGTKVRQAHYHCSYMLKPAFNFGIRIHVSLSCLDWSVTNIVSQAGFELETFLLSLLSNGEYFYSEWPDFLFCLFYISIQKMTMFKVIGR